MKGLPEERTIRLAQYMIEQKATVRRSAARKPTAQYGDQGDGIATPKAKGPSVK